MEVAWPWVEICSHWLWGPGGGTCFLVPPGGGFLVGQTTRVQSSELLRGPREAAEEGGT